MSKTVHMSPLRQALVAGLAAALLIGAPVVGVGSAEAQFRGPPPPPPYSRPGPRPSHRRGGGGGDAAAGAAVGILGGLLIGSAIQAQQQEEARQRMLYEDAVADCARRFRSYDPETETYIARGGQVRHCP